MKNGNSNRIYSLEVLLRRFTRSAGPPPVGNSRFEFIMTPAKYIKPECSFMYPTKRTFHKHNHDSKN